MNTLPQTNVPLGGTPTLAALMTRERWIEVARIVVTGLVALLYWQALVPLQVLWAAVAALMLATGVGGFWAGKANRSPLVEAKAQESEPSKDLQMADAPFQESDDVMVQIQNLSPEEIQSIADKVKKGH